MRVMQIIYSFGVGGAEVVARDIALNMISNVSHSIVALETDGPLLNVLSAKNIKLYVINRQPTERLGPMFRLWRAMRDFKPDVVHTHHLYMLFYTWPGALLIGARIIHTEHQYHSLTSDKARFRLRNLSRFCQAVTGVNKETSVFLRDQVRIPEYKIHTVANGIDLEKYRAGALSRTEIGLSSDDLVAGIIARLNPIKDHATLLNAFRLVVEHYPKAKLLIIGDGEERSNLEQLTSQLKLAQNVQFLGFRTDIPALLACLDIFVLSSRDEGLPLCILEAMASAKPVVATNVGGIPAIVKSGVTGLLVPPADPQTMAKALLEVFVDVAWGRDMGKNGRRLVEQYYDLKISLNQYYSLYKEALS